MAVSKFESREIHARRCPDLIGEGSIVDTDVLATNVAAYPKGSTYVDTAAGRMYLRVREEGRAID